MKIIGGFMVKINPKNLIPVILALILGLSSFVSAQKPKGPPPKPGDEKEGKTFILDPNADVPLTVDLEDNENEKVGLKRENEKEDDKKNKNEYFGLKTKKGFTKTGYGNNIVIEQFSYLKEYKEPNDYVRDVYWFHTEKEQIVNSRRIDKENAEILHGPYVKKTEEGEVLEEGFFFKGVKHGRWTKYNKNYILLDKHKYTRGWLRDSEISYYDRNEKQKIKEVIPKEYGEKNGEYFYFYENGQVAVEGQYTDDHKVGVWTEYFKGPGRQEKKQIQYRKDPYNNSFKPYIIKEWNEKGKVVYEKKSN